MTQGQMAAALGCSQKDVSRWERGVHSPRVDVLIKMADVLRCRIDDLIDRSRG
ncbi:MAG: helix-turn-helix transcriptional regulator [Clostridiales bacterium]|nr:helix-turn-helix transcriptional regulator [Clostridiales bacterium]